MSAAAPVLTHSHVFGFKTDVKQGIHLIDENVLLYPAGHTVVIYNVEMRQQKFIFGSDGCEITALALSPNKRFVAVAEKGERALITVFDVHTLRKRKVMNLGLVSEYLWLSFSADGKNLLSLGCAPDYYLTNWLWEKIRPLHNFKAGPLVNRSDADVDKGDEDEQAAMERAKARPLRACNYCPNDPSLVGIIGKGTVMMLRLESTSSATTAAGNSLVSQLDLHWENGKHLDFTCCDWIGDEWFVGTRSGRLYCLSHGELRREIPLLEDENERISLSSIISFEKGLAVGGKNGKLMLLDVVSHDGEETLLENCKLLTMPKGATLEDDACVSSMAVSPSKEAIVIALSNAQTFVLGISNLDILKSEEIRVERLLDSFHSDGIVGLDICIRKPLAATCGRDQSVRIWDYDTRRLYSCKTFAEAPHSIAFHPSGLHVLVGFNDKLRLMNVLMDDLRTYKELSIKNCRVCRFSNGGHLFAAVNGPIVAVYKTYTCELMVALRGHNQKVTSLSWSPDDTTLVTAGVDGAVYEFCLSTGVIGESANLENTGEKTAPNGANSVHNTAQVGLGARLQEFVQKGCKYYSSVSSSDHQVYAVGSDGVLKQIVESAVHKELDAGVVLTQLIMGQVRPEQKLFAGSEQGVIRSFKFPLTGHCQDYQCHSRSVTALRITVDDARLFSVGMDGCLFMFDVREKEGRALQSESGIRPSMIASDLWSQEELVSRADLEEGSFAMNELKSKVDELTLHNEYQLRLREMSHLDAVKEIKEAFTLRLEEEKKKYDLLKDEKQDMEMEQEESVKLMEETHVQLIAQLKQQHQDDIMSEVEQFHELEREMRLQEEEWEHRTAQAEEEHQDMLDARQIELEHELERAREQRERLMEEKNAVIREFNETKTQLEQDTDSEILELRSKFESTLSQERESTLRLKGENGIMKKRFSSLANDIEDQKEELKIMSEKSKELQRKTLELKQEIDVLKTQIAQRDTTIGEKERKIYELKKRNQELEKHKFVLDYKIKELKRQIEPRENKIAEMKDEELRVDHQLEWYHKKNGELHDQRMQLKEEIRIGQSNIGRKRIQARETAALLDRQHHSVQLLGTVIQDPQKLRARTEEMHSMFVRSTVSKVEVDPHVLREYRRQRGFLDRSVDALKKKLVHEVQTHRRDNQRILQENVELIREINELRIELRTIQMAQQEKNRRLQGKDHSKRSPRAASRKEELRQQLQHQQRYIEELQSRLIAPSPSA